MGAIIHRCESPSLSILFLKPFVHVLSCLLQVWCQVREEEEKEREREREKEGRRGQGGKGRERH